jgi:acetoacetate decarboxylase
MSQQGEFTFARDQVYFMPASFGAWTSEGGLNYAEVRHIAIQYVTDPVKAARLVPEAFTVSDPAVVTVLHSECHGVGFLGGNGYNLVAVSIGATFTGGDKPVQGQYLLVVWENQFLPVMTGREVLGWPKLLADVPDPWLLEGRRGFHVSENGSMLLEAEVWEMNPVGDADRAGLEAQQNGMGLFVWKYIPSSMGLNSDVSYPAVQYNKTAVTRAWAGQGKVEFRPTTQHRAPMSAPIVNALAELPVVSPAGAAMMDCSSELGLSEPLR